MKSFSAWLLCLGWLLLATAGQAAETAALVRPKLGDAQIKKLVTGQWSNLQKGFRGKLVYAADGKSTCELVPVDFLTKMLLSTYAFEGTWQIKDGLLYTKVIKSSSKNFPIGETYRDEILDLTPDSMTLRNQKQMVTRFERVK
jgi:hypothetical protein